MNITNKIKIVFLALGISLFLTACGNDQTIANNVNTYEAGESVIVSKGDTYRGLTNDTEVIMVTNPETEETTITVTAGSIEVTTN